MTTRERGRGQSTNERGAFFGRVEQEPLYFRAAAVASARETDARAVSQARIFSGKKPAFLRKLKARGYFQWRM